VFWISAAGDLQRTSKLAGVPKRVASNVEGGLRADPSAAYYWRRVTSGETVRYELWRLGN
jgi:hypothetical protein